MKIIMSAILFLLTTISIPGISFFLLPVSGSITYPIVNSTVEYTFEFVSVQSTPSSGGPSCTACATSNCTNPCASDVANPENCICVLPPSGYQWLNNMTTNENQIISIVYNAKDSLGNAVGTITLTIHVGFYTEPQITNGVDNVIEFSVSYAVTTNNSTYSGPCWSIGTAVG